MPDGIVEFAIQSQQVTQAVEVFNQLDKAQQKVVLTTLELDRAGAKAGQSHEEMGKKAKHAHEGWAEKAKEGAKEVASELGLVTTAMGAVMVVVESGKELWAAYKEQRQEALKGGEAQATAMYTIDQASGGNRARHEQMTEAAEEFRRATGQSETSSATVAAKLVKGGLRGDLHDFVALQQAMGPSADILPMIQATVNARLGGEQAPTRALLSKYYAAGPDVTRVAGEAGLVGAGMSYSQDERLAMAAAMDRSGHAEDLPALLKGLSKMHLAGKPIEEAMAAVQARAATYHDPRQQAEFYTQAFGRPNAQIAFNALSQAMPLYREKLASFSANRDVLSETLGEQTLAQKSVALGGRQKAEKERMLVEEGGNLALAQERYYALRENSQIATVPGAIKRGLTYKPTNWVEDASIPSQSAEELLADVQRGGFMTSAATPTINPDASPAVREQYDELVAQLKELVAEQKKTQAALAANTTATHANTLAPATPAATHAPASHAPPP